MRKKTIELGLFIILISLQDFLFFYLYQIRIIGSLVYYADGLFKLLLLFFLAQDFLYKRVYNLQSHRFKSIIFIAGPLMLATIIGSRLASMNKLYFKLKNVKYEHTKGLWAPDEVLGHKAIPNANGYYRYFLQGGLSDSIPVIFDERGHRTVPDSLRISSSVQDLYLGCSWTFGDFVLAQESFPYLTSKRLGHDYVNAGASAYGLAQMLHLAKSIIPQKKFHYVFIQYSPWLVERAASFDNPYFYGYRPFPYFTESADTFKLVENQYSSRMYFQESVSIRETPMSYMEKAIFSFTQGYKIELIDYFSFITFKLKAALGLTPRPTDNWEGLENYVYSKIIELCNRNGAKPVVLGLQQYPWAAERAKELSNHAVSINLDYHINSLCLKKKLEFANLFNIYHVNGRDTIYFDAHPNPWAHQIFSDQIINGLNRKK